jgi:hypothetical protein
MAGFDNQSELNYSSKGLVWLLTTRMRTVSVRFYGGIRARSCHRKEAVLNNYLIDRLTECFHFFQPPHYPVPSRNALGRQT